MMSTQGLMVIAVPPRFPLFCLTATEKELHFFSVTDLSFKTVLRPHDIETLCHMIRPVCSIPTMYTVSLYDHNVLLLFYDSEHTSKHLTLLSERIYLFI